MTPEEEARQNIDRLLEAAGWVIQDYRDLNLGASLGIAIREFPLKSGTADPQSQGTTFILQAVEALFQCAQHLYCTKCS